jgi:hypothetical protein
MTIDRWALGILAVLSMSGSRPGLGEDFALRDGDEGRLIGTVTDQQLQEGLNIASMTTDPWEPGGPWT